MTNQPEVSKTIAWSYGCLAILIAAIMATFASAGFCTPMQTGGIVSATVLAFAEAIMLFLLRSL